MVPLIYVLILRLSMLILDSFYLNFMLEIFCFVVMGFRLNCLATVACLVVSSFMLTGGSIDMNHGLLLMSGLAIFPLVKKVDFLATRTGGRALI